MRRLPKADPKELRGPEIPVDRDTGLPLLREVKCDLDWEHVILDKQNFETFQEVVAENENIDLLSAHNLKPKNKLLFFGPPGTGKTQTAKVLSGSLNLPLVTVNLGCIFSSYLGQTSTNLQKIFDYLSLDDNVVFFDEFDSLAGSRNISGDSTEVRRAVNSLLQLIDGINRGVLIAATNNQKLLDTAVWRRFDEVLMFDKPNAESRVLILNRYLSTIQHELPLPNFADRLNGATGADIERICANAIKETLLRGDSVLDEATISRAIDRFLKRSAMVAIV